MSVTRSCSPGNGAVELDSSAGEYIEYRISSADPHVQYALAGGGSTLFDNASRPAPCTYRWPPDGEQPQPGEVDHALGMQFFGDDTLSYEVDRKSAGGSVIDVVKRCSFVNSGGADDFFEPLTIFVS